jgi:hypothetical protein
MHSQPSLPAPQALLVAADEVIESQRFFPQRGLSAFDAVDGSSTGT